MMSLSINTCAIVRANHATEKVRFQKWIWVFLWVSAFGILSCRSLTKDGYPSSFVELKAEDFQEKVLSSQGYVLVEISASWCKACKDVAKYVDKTSRKYHLPVYLLSWEEESAISKKYNTYLGSVLIFRNGRLSARLGNLILAKQLTYVMKQLLDRETSYQNQSEKEKEAAFYPEQLPTDVDYWIPLVPKGVHIQDQ